MKIKLAILDMDENYLKRVVNILNTKYADKLEVYSFNDIAVALRDLKMLKPDILLAYNDFNVDLSLLPQRCAFAYLVDAPDVESYHSQRAIGKFQRVDMIYKQILGIYSENAERFSLSRQGEGAGRVIAFGAASGGCGASTMAAACAKHFAAKGYKVLYLNLEQLGSADLFFSGEGQFDLSKIIFALKSKKTNLPLLLESFVKQDPSGVYYYSSPGIALDMLELTTEDIIQLLVEIKNSCPFEFVILDSDFSINREVLKIYQQAHAVVLVSDGSVEANTKLFRAYMALAQIDSGLEEPLLSRIFLLYNKFSSKTGKMAEGVPLTIIGGYPKYEQASTLDIISQIINDKAFDQLL